MDSYLNWVRIIALTLSVINNLKGQALKSALKRIQNEKAMAVNCCSYASVLFRKIIWSAA